MKTKTTIGERRFKVWKTCSNKIRIDLHLVEFDSPKTEWIRPDCLGWNRKLKRNEVDKQTGKTQYTDTAEKEMVFKSEASAKKYAETLN